jgi:anti-sigma regulatory factor (Ser/Thr protein kinase)
MAKAGRNPARIIPAWRRFVDEHAGPGVRLRGIGEPISVERDADELVECQRHESLLNLAFRSAEAFWLLCPYDAHALSEEVLEEARRSHPYVTERGYAHASMSYAPTERLGEPLPDPPPGAAALEFGQGPLEPVRRFVAEQALRAGLTRHRGLDAVVAVNEVASNSIEHGAGGGVLRIWNGKRRFVCEVQDGGRLDDPLADRRLPVEESSHGRGFWIANQLCDLVQVRSLRTGTVVRLHIARA